MAEHMTDDLRHALSTVMTIAADEMEKAGTLVVERWADLASQARAANPTTVHLTPLGIERYPGKTADEALRDYSLSILDRLVLDLHNGTRH